MCFEEYYLRCNVFTHLSLTSAVVQLYTDKRISVVTKSETKFSSGQPVNMTLRLVSWNTRGLKSPRSKLDNVLKMLSTLRASIAFLQETHIGPGDERILTSIPGWQSYFTVYKNNSKGVAILIKDNLQFKYICHDEDYYGGYIVLFCQVNNHVYTLGNVYKHRADDRTLRRLAQYLQETVTGTLVIGGDFNGVLEPTFDRSNPSSRSKPAKHLSDFLSSMDLMDIWVTKHPTGRGFTYKQKDALSRIDMFFMPQKYIRSVKSCEMQKSTISDHQPLFLEILLPTVHRSSSEPLEKKMQNVSTRLGEFDIRKADICRTEIISGVDLLMAIKSLRVFSQESTNKGIAMYKNSYLQKTEELKQLHAKLVRMRNVPDHLKCKCFISESTPSEHSSTEHLIFAKTLAELLSADLLPNFKNSTGGPEHTLCFIFQFKTAESKINTEFLNRMLGTDCGRDLSVVANLLRDYSSHQKQLMEGCPLTPALLTLALRDLADKIKGKIRNCEMNLSQTRLTLLVYGDENSESMVRTLHQDFKDESGLELLLEKKTMGCSGKNAVLQLK
ncbi:hypothetical protein ACEWY4_019719 [Coilia grayii]|uniref:exodeoxyribonuclease III n=1 Tax=Coilia grayii TaxID=363190 RepID=A0ABD1JDR0_9TELE